MIDLHCHMLPGIDDGARDLASALDMARLAVADGIRHTVCTPHIYPGLYENTVPGIAAATRAFRAELENAGIPLTVSYGADIQIVPELVAGLQGGALPTLHGSRYFLFEPPHHIQPPGMLELIHSAVAAGYVPVITHPERLTWAEGAYTQFAEAARLGAWIQLTGGSLLGVWGPRVKAFSERFLADGITHLVASDGHNQSNRSPTLGPARAVLVELVGEAEAHRLVSQRPAAVLADAAPVEVAPPNPAAPAPRRRWWWFGGTTQDSL
ncbi:CpsB/CapC family capsule biosynthesis tyrosine phosphatase [Haliea sp. E1-2-M8]|uniref:tyrosine-protein phosphatase n=1 Tax=Haliea sp. E1-2-M8 TaxID=3064706 RepID=UPI00271EB83C|nr:CpsB/CapC family capsule biosynthesis tyrosine phosphatase [Haliea sp. E1-2-M8]MDO8862434.1 CpsB/CapC family capsule biosynthesis tyrosine phosphatase [Haliea sp. E1-2-M8]